MQLEFEQARSEAMDQSLQLLGVLRDQLGSLEEAIIAGDSTNRNEMGRSVIDVGVHLRILATLVLAAE